MLVRELLCNGASPARVRAILQTTSAFFTGKEQSELPSTPYVRECRTIVQVLNDLLGAYKLGKQETWHQVCTDESTRRQNIFTTIVIGYLVNKIFESVIASLCHFAKSQKLDSQIESLEDKVCMYVHVLPVLTSS